VRRGPVGAVALVVIAVVVLRPDSPGNNVLPGQGWSDEERAVLRSLALLPGGWRPPPDPSNRFADDPAAAALGRELFRDTRLSANGEVSCATCHQRERGFQDGRRRGRGLATTPRRTMPLAGAAANTWFFWDGRKDSLWSQALEPLESPAEHGLTRAQVVRLVARHHRAAYEAVFGPLAAHSVDGAFANVGKAIAAFERTIRPRRTRFDRFVAGEAVLSAQEVEGLRLFVGEGHCTDCHSGALLTNGEFHDTGIGRGDPGRAAALARVRADEFNCLGRYSDARPGECALRFLPATARPGAFKPPSLRGVARRAPYMHAGQLASLDEVLRHYNRPPRGTELHPLGLGGDQLDALEAFLRTL
jgi:cytochrome c peroxidase